MLSVIQLVTQAEVCVETVPIGTIQKGIMALVGIEKTDTEKETEKLILKGTKQIKKEREPIAFGLVAIKILFTWDEASSTDELLDNIRKIKDVSSAEIIDFRRAIG